MINLQENKTEFITKFKKFLQSSKTATEPRFTQSIGPNFVGFSLAEVLITLGIIGVVAALTMPMLVSSYKKQVVETRLKYFYSSINQALNQAKVEYGEIETNSYTPSLSSEERYRYYLDWLNKYIIPYMNGVNTYSCNTSRVCMSLPNGTVVVWGVDGVALILDKNITDDRSPSQLSKHFQGKNCFGFVYNSSTTSVEPRKTNASDEVLLTHQAYGCRNNANSCYGSGNNYCTNIIFRNGWKIPNNYPIKF